MAHTDVDCSATKDSCQKVSKFSKVKSYKHVHGICTKMRTVPIHIQKHQAVCISHRYL